MGEMGSLTSGSWIARPFRIGEPPALCSRGSWSLHWRPGRAAGWAEAVFQAQGPGSRQRPGGIAQRAVSSYGLAYSGNIIVKHRGVDVLHPAGAPRRQSRLQPDRARRVGRQRVQAGPAPVFHPLHQAGPQRVAFDVPQHHPEMIVLLDREGFESALPDMPAGMVMFLVPTDMGRQQPVNPPADVPIVPGPKNQMEMVGHQAIGQDPHGLPKRCFGDHVEERLKVLVLVENLSAGIAPIEHVIAVTSGRRSRRARHDETPISRENHFRTAPPILPRSLGELPVSPFRLLRLATRSRLGWPLSRLYSIRGWPRATAGSTCVVGLAPNRVK